MPVGILAIAFLGRGRPGAYDQGPLRVILPSLHIS